MPALASVATVIVVLAVLAINKKTGKVEREPEVMMRGFGGADITDEAREVVLKTLDGLTIEQKSDYGTVNERVRVELKRFIQKGVAWLQQNQRASGKWLPTSAPSTFW